MKNPVRNGVPNRASRVVVASHDAQEASREPYHRTGGEQSLIWRFMGIVPGRPGTTSPQVTASLAPRVGAVSFPTDTKSHRLELVCPFAQSDGHDLPGSVDKGIPSVTAVIDDIVVRFEDAVREPVVAHILPDIFDRIEFRGFRRQRDNGDMREPLILPIDAIRLDRREGRHGIPVRRRWRFRPDAGSSPRYCRRAGSRRLPFPASGRWLRRCRSRRCADPAERSGECRA